LILWTTSTAIGLMVIRLIMISKNWSAETLGVENAGIAILMGVCGAALAIIWLAIFRGAIWSRVLVRSLFAIPAFAVVIVFFYIVAIQFITSGIVDPTTTLIPLVGQTVIIGLTLLAMLNHSRR
jgi:hypothetical protein